MRLFFSMALSLCLALAGGSAWAQTDAEPRRVLELVPAPEAPPSEPARPEEPIEAQENLLESPEAEPLDLGAERRAPRAPRCAPIGRAAAIGVWPQAREALGLCPARAALAPFLAQSARALTQELWCSDPQGAKALARRRALEAQSASRRPSGSSAPAALAPKSASGSFFRWDFSLAAPSRAAASRESAPKEPAAREPALEWDAREAQACAAWGEGRPELTVSVSARAVGRASLGGRDCPALLAEAQALNGRFAGARAPLLIGLEDCSSLSAPMSSPLSAAFVSEAAAQAWSAELLRAAQWRGPSPSPRGPFIPSIPAR